MVLDMSRAGPPGGEIVVLSPHLDDAVLSLGASVRAWSRAGARVRVVTVLAGRPRSTAAAGPWDAASGFATEGEATRARREEDRSACAIVGAEPSWMDHADQQYERGGTDDEIWTAIHDRIGAAPTVLAPGFPLLHRDHAWLGVLALMRRDRSWRFGLYVEQPYAIGSGRPRDHDGRLGFEPPFEPVPASTSDRRRKRRALLAYRSQHEQLAEVVSGSWTDLQRRMSALERRRGGEMVAWLD
jgi:LmbE family N-acetylglucosaminyl deacetylase